MKGLKVTILYLLISIVNSERSNHIQRSGGNVLDSSGSDEDNIQYKKLGSGSSSTADSKILLDILLPESIRYMEVTKVDVMIYNNMGSKKPVDVEVTIPNDVDNYNFRFFKNKFDPKNEPELTKVTTVPFGRPQNISFYIQTTEKLNLYDVINIKVKASVKSENFESFLKKPVNIKPPGFKTYHNHYSTFNLIPRNNQDWMPIYPFNPYESAKIDELRMILEISGHRNKFNKVDFSVAISNKNDFEQVVHVTTEDDPIEVILPENTTYAEAWAEGTGYCMITAITQRAVLNQNLDPQFKLNITRLSSPSNNEAIVRVCAAYNPRVNEWPTIQEVLYDIEMPSGYIYKEVINESKIPEIKLVEPRWAKSHVLIFFNEYQKDINYCVDIRAQKIKEIRNAADAVVMVYNYNYFDNVAVGYYNFYG